MLRLSVLLISLWSRSECVVNFKNAQLFDEFDLRASAKIPLKSEGGCYVYASLRESVDEQFESSIVIRDKHGKFSHSLWEIGRSYDAAQQMRKRFFDFPKTDGSYFIVRIGGNLADTKPVALYVVSKHYIDSFSISPPPVFEPRIQPIASISTQHVVFLSAEPFTLTGVRLTKKNRVRIFASGPDTVLGNNNDDCFALYDDESDAHAGLLLPIRSPIVTVSTQETQPLHFSVSAKLESVALTSGTNTLITSPGYIGCSGSGGGLFHWRDAEKSISQSLEGDGLRIIYVDSDVNSNDPVSITGEKTDQLFGNRKSYAAYNSTSLKVEWTKTKDVDEYFALRIQVNGTASGVTGSSTPMTLDHSTSQPPDLSTSITVSSRGTVPLFALSLALFVVAA